MSNTKHKVAPGLILWSMETFGYYGWTSFWNTIYYISEEHLKYTPLRKHELKHIEQMEQEGKFIFSVKYLYYNYKVGYFNNPYEIEARAAETV